MKKTISVTFLISCILLTSMLTVASAPTARSQPVINATGTAHTAVYVVQCLQGEQLAYHIHMHLTIYQNGRKISIPGRIGITSCYYFLHTHIPDGVIHIESLIQGIYTLGSFLYLWKTKFSPLQYPTLLDKNSGWTSYRNGKRYNGDFYTIGLNSHDLITLIYNSPGVQPDTTYAWPQGY